jgi:predicted nucleic acid-binding protein
MSYLIDTNIISEVRKGGNCDPNVAAWYASVDDTAIYISVLVLGEIRRGIERARPRDRLRTRALETWLATVRESFADRILPIDGPVADEWGRMGARRSVPSIDALLAATAKVHRMTLATRNLADVANLGADVVNPFEQKPAR